MLRGGTCERGEDVLAEEIEMVFPNLWRRKIKSWEEL